MNSRKLLSIRFWTVKQLGFVLTLLLVSSITSMFFFDQLITQYSHESVDQGYFPVVRFITWMGLADQYFVISILGYFGFRYLENKNNMTRARDLKEKFKFMFWAFLISGLLVHVFKAAVGRRRPYHSPGFEPLDFNFFTTDWNYHAYPSGHTQVGFTVASVLSVMFPRFSIYFWIFAGLVGLSRVVLQYHFLGDTLAGAAVGILGTYLVAKKMKLLANE